MPTLDPYLYRPVIAGMWRQHEATDGTYSFQDLINAHEILDVKDANESAFREWVKSNHE